MGERQTVAELYRKCEVNCGGAKGSLVSCVMYRGILNCAGAKGSLVSCVMYRGI